MLAVSAVVAMAQQRTIWQIGKFDDSSQEFRSQNIDYASPKSDVVYTVGVSTEKDWLSFQPGPANAIAGGRQHPFQVNFTLPNPPRGVYRLRVAILYETPRLSALQLSVNGYSGMFYFHPRLDYAAGDWAGTFVPQTSHVQKVIDIPARWLRRGANTFVFTAVDDPSTPQTSMGDIAPGQSGLVYDALSLTQDESAKYARGEVSALTIPTIFYKHVGDKDGSKLDEIVEVFLAFHAGAKLHGKVELVLGGRRFTQPLNLRGEFGEAKLRFAVPEWTGTETGRVVVDGHAFSVELKAAKKWTLDVVPQEHLDIGFTDYRMKVAELQSESVDGVLNELRTHPNFRWSLDGSWIAQQYLATRSKARRTEFLNAVRAGQIVIPAEFANQYTGVASLEGLIRSLYPSHALAEKYHLPIGAANITDVPSYTWSYASVLHDAGIQYLVAGSNAWRAPVVLEGRWNTKSPFWWEGPDGGRVLMWYSRAYLQLASMYGTPPTLPAIEDATPVFLQAYERPDYVANSVILYGSQLENTPLDRAQVTLPARWGAEYAWPKLVFTTFKAAMASLEQQFGDKLPTYRGDFGPYWEDGMTSNAQHTALFRRDQRRILTAEKMSTIPTLLNPSLRPDRAQLNNAWHNLLLFDEHTWTAATAATMPDGDQNRRQLRQKLLEPVVARTDIAQTIERSWAQLESILHPAQNSIAVFNSLSWPRSGWVDADVPVGQEVVNPTTRLPVVQVILRREPGTMLPGVGGATNRVRFRAADVPAMGYKLFALAPRAGDATYKPVIDKNAEHNLIIENRYYRITLDPAHGAIRSVYDKQLHRELVNASSPYAFGAYIYVEGADNMPANSLYRYGAAQTLPVLHPVEAANGRLVSITDSEQGVTAILESSAPNTPSIRTVILLPANQKRIEITYHIDKTATLRKEAAYIAFPWAGPHPVFRYETQSGWVNPARNELVGGCREWYAVNHWAAMTSGGVTMAVLPVGAPMVAFGDIVRGTWPLEFHPASSTIFSWIMSNYWDTNFAPEQGGHITLHYTLVSMPGFNGPQLARIGWESATRMESDPVHANAAKGILPANEASFLSVGNPDVAVITWKLAANGDGSILRLVNLSKQKASVRLTAPLLRIQRAWQCNALEENQHEVAVAPDGVHLSVPAFGIVTLRLKTSPQAGAATGGQP